MSASITSGTYPRTATGPGALQRAARATWQFLLALGARRAQRHMAVLALHYDLTNPTLARELREAAAHALRG